MRGFGVNSKPLKSNIMKSEIEILSADAKQQLARIDCLVYEFNFSEYELANVINHNNSTSELEQMSGLDSADVTSFEMAQYVAEEWNKEDVLLLVQDFITDHSENLPDHLHYCNN